MNEGRGFTLIDLGVVGGLLAAGGALSQVAGLRPADSRSQSFAILQSHAMALGQYRADNAGYFPITYTYMRGTASSPTSGALVGWCTWSHAGKNNAGWWAPSASTGFDIEAADRPLNAYLYPGVTFFAPPPPARLGASDPARAQPAELNRDPADDVSHERTWPRATRGVSTYDDVGTSYHWQSEWIEQVTRAGFSFSTAINEGGRRLAVGQGVTPSRFVWEDDPFVAITTSGAASAQIRNWWRETNRSVMLFVDGHAGYHATNPGRRAVSYRTSDYSLIFDDLPNPGFP